MANLTILDVKQELAQVHMKVLQNYLWDEDMTKKFLSAVSYAIEKTPQLLDVDKSSLFQSIINCAEIRMFPWVSWEVYILPYKGRAQFILWYQWLITLLYRAWITWIRWVIVKENDEFEEILWLEPTIIHKTPKLGTRWEAIWCYVYCKVNWQQEFKYMRKEEILKFKEFSQSKNSIYSPWNEKNDPELNMWLKTVLRQLSKTLPKNEEIYKALEKDNDDWDIKAYIDEKMNEQKMEVAITKAQELNQKYLIENNISSVKVDMNDWWILIEEDEVIVEKSDFIKEQESEIESKKTMKHEKEAWKTDEILEKQKIAHEVIQNDPQFQEIFSEESKELLSEKQLKDKRTILRVQYQTATQMLRTNSENQDAKDRQTDTRSQILTINEELMARFWNKD